MNTIRNSTESRWIEALRAGVEEAIASALADLEAGRLRDAVTHAVTGGKRVRPMLLTSMCGAVGGREERAYDAAAAMEFLHASSLAHDDIMDGSELRRGRQTVHRMYGVPTAILAGDALIALAFRAIRRVPDPAGPGVLHELSEAFLRTCEGQGLDLQLAGRSSCPPDLHRRMVEKKTARLMEAAAKIGALLGTADPTVVQGSALFGRHLGMAFQANDDLLDAVGDEAVMGKPVGMDSRNAKQTYLTLAFPSDNSARLTGDCAVPATKQLVAGHTAAACAFLDTLPPSRPRSMLRTLALSLAERRS